MLIFVTQHALLSRTCVLRRPTAATAQFWIVLTLTAWRGHRVASGTPHFHWAKSGEYVTQISAIGPLGLDYIDPSDDPRTTASRVPPAAHATART